MTDPKYVKVNVDNPVTINNSARLRFLTSYYTSLKRLESSNSNSKEKISNDLFGVYNDFENKLYPDKGMLEPRSLREHIISVKDEINQVLANPFEVTGKDQTLDQQQRKNIHQQELTFSKLSNKVLKSSLDKLIKVVKTYDSDIKSQNSLFVESQKPQYRGFTYQNYQFTGTHDNTNFSAKIEKDPITPEQMDNLLGAGWNGPPQIISGNDITAANGQGHAGSKFRSALPCNLTKTTFEHNGQTMTLYSHSDLSPEKHNLPAELDKNQKKVMMQSITTNNNEAVFLRAMGMHKENDQYTSFAPDAPDVDKVYCTTSLVSNFLEQDLTNLKTNAISTIKERCNNPNIRIFSFNFPLNDLRNTKIGSKSSHSSKDSNSEELARLIKYALRGNDQLDKGESLESLQQEIHSQFQISSVSSGDMTRGSEFNHENKKLDKLNKIIISFNDAYTKKGNEKHFLHLNQMVTSLINDLPTYPGPKNKLSQDNVKQFLHCKSGKDRTFASIINSGKRFISPEGPQPELTYKLYQGLGRTIHGLLDNLGCTGIKTLSGPTLMSFIQSKMKRHRPKGKDKSSLFEQDDFDLMRNLGITETADINSSWNNGIQSRGREKDIKKLLNKNPNIIKRRHSTVTKTNTAKEDLRIRRAKTNPGSNGNTKVRKSLKDLIESKVKSSKKDSENAAPVSSNDRRSIRSPSG